MAAIFLKVGWRIILGYTTDYNRPQKLGCKIPNIGTWIDGLRNCNKCGLQIPTVAGKQNGLRYSTPGTSFNVYSFTGDTILYGTLYKKMGGYYFREDTILRKIYVKIFPDSAEQLLYDYTLHAGDTFRSPHAIDHVTGVDSVMINSVWHRVWHFQGDSLDPAISGMHLVDYDVIEGIGSDDDIIFPLKPYAFEGCISLTCFSNQGTTPPLSRTVGAYFNNTTSCSLTFGLGVPNVGNKMVDLELLPNPTTTSLTITSIDKITTIAISNLLGQTLYSHDFSAYKVQVNVADLPTGIYFVKINGTEVRKFVKE